VHDKTTLIHISLPSGTGMTCMQQWPSFTEWKEDWIRAVVSILEMATANAIILIWWISVHTSAKNTNQTYLNAFQDLLQYSHTYLGSILIGIW